MRTKTIGGGRVVMAKRRRGRRGLEAIIGSPADDHARFDRLARDFTANNAPCHVVEIDGRLYLEVEPTPNP